MESLSKMYIRAQAFMDFAESLSRQSKCEQRKVACIICDSDLSQIISIGLNGGAKDLDQCLCVLPGKYGCIHAELQALMKADRSVDGCTAFITLSPCIQCAAAMINAGIKKVYYRSVWKDTSGLEMLKRANVALFKID